MKFRVEVDRIIGRVTYEVDVDPANGRDDAVAAVLSTLRTDPATATRQFDAAAVQADGTRLVEYEVHQVIPIAPPRLSADPHHKPLDPKGAPERQEL